MEINKLRLEVEMVIMCGGVTGRCVRAASGSRPLPSFIWVVAATLFTHLVKIHWAASFHMLIFFLTFI